MENSLFKVRIFPETGVAAYENLSEIQFWFNKKTNETYALKYRISQNQTLWMKLIILRT